MERRIFSGKLKGIPAVIALSLILTGSSGAGDNGELLHTFTGGQDGANPAGVLVLDSAGNLYGTTYAGGNDDECTFEPPDGCGVVFQLTPVAGGGWQGRLLHTFTGGNDGGNPLAGLIIDAAGNLYGTTRGGGTNCLGCGTVFKLAPAGDGTWHETVLYNFCSVANCADGEQPWAGLLLDSAGNLYGTTQTGGIGTCAPEGCGVVFELTPTSDGWKETVLHAFTGGGDGGNPTASLALDPAGNLYGTTAYGGTIGANCFHDLSGTGCGVAFELTPNSNGWKGTVLHAFSGDRDGGNPLAGLTLDSAGNLYGTTASGGNVSDCKALQYDGCGVVFELTPTSSKGGWKETVLHAFTGGVDGYLPQAALIFDGAGDLYGTTWSGVVFELKPNSNGWQGNVLASQTGASIWAGLTLDSAGNLYGTTYYGGNLRDCYYGPGCGVVFELRASDVRQ